MAKSNRRRWAACAALALSAAAGAARAEAMLKATPIAYQPSLSELGQLSIEELANLPVTSVAKRAEPLSAAPAAIYVVTREEIERSGARTVPEMLRLAPNLHVARTSAHSWVVTARGFSGNQAAQSFTNQLLVLIDGRSVYTPLYSGVYWDMQDVLPADIERIEVISGPGATLWGANAVNGVINIITRSAADTQGGRVDVGAGDLRTDWSARYGGRVGPDLAWRAYFRTFWQRDTVTGANLNGRDHWSRPQGGVRLDWTPSRQDSITLQGDGYAGSEAVANSANERIAGRNVTARWTHAFTDSSTVQMQGYYDRTERGQVTDSGDFWLETFDLDVQHSFTLGARHAVVWGGGGRTSRYRINGTSSLLFVPAGRRLDLADLFVQDTVALASRLKLTARLKLEDDPYVGLSVLPDLRLSFTPSEQTLLWAAASRAVRSPTPFDRDVVEKVRGLVFLTGNPNWRSVTLTAVQAGARAQFGDRASLSVSTYYNLYDNLRSIEPTPGTFTPLYWGNGIRGDTYGLEAWGDYRVTDWWRMRAGVNLIAQRLEFKPGASGLLGLSQVGDDPRQQAQLKSSMNLPHRVTLDAQLRYVSSLPDPRVPAYTELNGRIAWTVRDGLQLAVTGQNLLNPRHQEFPAPGANAFPRNLLVSLSWGF